ncbi:hypothetical protein K7G98_17635 [Saccharothrix sp. MB29]|nr:hypothetical protein [Saccharothrix sp. MB29]
MTTVHGAGVPAAREHGDFGLVGVPPVERWMSLGLSSLRTVDLADENRVMLGARHRNYSDQHDPVVHHIFERAPAA